MRKFLIIVIIFFVVGCVAVEMAMWNYTLVDIAVPLSVGGCGAMVTGLIFGKSWRNVTGSSSRVLNFCCQAVFGFVLFSAAFFMINSWMADDDRYDVKVEVMERIREKHRQTKRVGRRYVADGPEYYMHYLKVRFDDGQTKMITADHGEYAHSMAGDSVTVEMQRGRFGYSVIKGLKRKK